jgi:DNA-binding CsgD family transcriptional regulator
VSLLDRLRTALMLVDDCGRAVFMNKAAERLTDEGSLGLNRDGLSAENPADTRALRHAIRTLSREPATATRGVPLARVGRLPLLATVLPVSQVGIALPGCSAPRAAVFLTEPDRKGEIDRQAVADLFGLTPRETDVALLLAEGMKPQGIAERLGLGRGTVGSHLKRAFDKTETHSQAALAVLLRQFTRPAE